MESSIQTAQKNIQCLLDWSYGQYPEFEVQLANYLEFYRKLPESYQQIQNEDDIGIFVRNEMRSAGIIKLFDEPQQYRGLSICVLLDGILGKHLQDFMTLITYHKTAEPSLQKRLQVELEKSAKRLCLNSPCLDAYTTELDRLVRIFTEPIEEAHEIQGATLTSEHCQNSVPLVLIQDKESDFEKAVSALDCFGMMLERNALDETYKTPENFAIYLQMIQFYGNQHLGTVAIRKFQDVCNLIQAVYLVSDIRDVM